jgi:uncharacterized protein
MYLDIKDRLILSNQFKILAALYPDDAQYFERAREVFESGYEQLYAWYSEHINSEIMSEDESHEVFDILNMYQDLQYSFEKLSDKAGINADGIRFPGFDGNNEGKQIGLLRFLVEQEKKYEYINHSSDNLNSHMPTLDIYRRMLAPWRALDRRTPFGKDDIIKILSARIHPSHR